MLNLFIDTSTDFLILILEKNNKIIGKIYQNNMRCHIEKTLPTIKKLLNFNKLKLKDINNFYLTIGPGSYTGIRIPIIIIKTIKIINNIINVYVINTLIYQAGLDNVISMIDAKGGKWYFAVINDGVEIIKSQLFDYKICLKIINKFPNYKIRCDLRKINFIKNFIVLKKHFKLVKNILYLEPKYLKKDWN